MSLLDETIASVAPADASLAAAAQRRLDVKTKPRGSLGRLEELACRIAAVRGTLDLPPLRAAIVVMAADHGVAREGVSAYPQEVTRQMLLNFAAGGAAINVLARRAGARVVVVDMGVAEPLPEHPAIRVARIGLGTRSLAHGPAMSRDQAVAALEVGIRIAHELAADGTTLLGLGEMGIGNTTSASALAAALTGCDPAQVTGRGTGVDDAGLARKAEVIRRALAVNHPDPDDPLGVLAALGGFEIAGLAGVALGGAASRVPVVVDGFIAAAAALVAVRLCPAARDALVAAHRSVEIGHARVLAAIGIEPLLDLRLRLGEGTGAALVVPIIDAALDVLRDMATFESAGVSDSGS
ncbi:MAG TPA: nicotinate-nucleotide--dimethylbenzimidazole phosphoribosyltransferase [Candidatus Binatia bacterium]|nr:nicotinate-nucleotide--dimethylbenzimidazole phosphoribosyltransferase [Candidatus Binatia bacterium]